MGISNWIPRDNRDRINGNKVMTISWFDSIICESKSIKWFSIKKMPIWLFLIINEWIKNEHSWITSSCEFENKEIRSNKNSSGSMGIDLHSSRCFLKALIISKTKNKFWDLMAMHSSFWKWYKSGSKMFDDSNVHGYSLSGKTLNWDEIIDLESPFDDFQRINGQSSYKWSFSHRRALMNLVHSNEEKPNNLNK